MPVIIFQHPLEAKHAKSTVPLLRLCLPDIRIAVAEQLTPPPPLVSGNWWLLYPATDAVDVDQLSLLPISGQPLAAVSAENLQAKKQIGGLIVLDGTWRKTRLLLHLNPWLTALPCLTFSQAPASGYAIRKGPGGQALSTLESVCHVLSKLHPEFVTAPLHRLLQVRVNQFHVNGGVNKSTSAREC